MIAVFKQYDSLERRNRFGKSFRVKFRYRSWVQNIGFADQGRHFNFFSEGAKLFLFFNATELLKNWKKYHLICINLTLFIVHFFLSFFLSSFFYFFLSFFFLFSILFFHGGGATAPAPSNDTPVADTLDTYFSEFWLKTGEFEEKVKKFFLIGQKQANMAIFVTHPKVSLTISHGFIVFSWY